MKRLVSTVLVCAIVACNDAEPPAGKVTTSDVMHFASAYARFQSTGNCEAFDSYFASASAGLRAFPKITGGRDELCAAVRAYPARYAGLQKQLPEIEGAPLAIQRVYDSFAARVPQSELIDTYIVVGRGWWGGTVRKGHIYVGAEAVESAARIPCLVAHELAHAQQRYPKRRLLTGGPAMFRGTLLTHAIKEGAADFVAEHATGCSENTSRNTWANAREAQLWQEFQRVMHGKNYSGWMYASAQGDRPADLAYYIGYRIVQSYYTRMPDKEQALRDILTIRDFPAFLARSGYDGSAGPRVPAAS